MDDRSTPNFYSAEVALWIDCGQFGSVPLAQTADTFVIVAVPAEIPACLATVFLSVDGRVHKRRVNLVNGISAKKRRSLVLAADEVAPF